jgi:hypothetical protein
MTETFKHKIANSFPEKFDESKLKIEINDSEYKIFEEGIFSKSMDEKWNVFVIDSCIYFARSWTHFCIYKILVNRQNEKVILSTFKVNRDENQYNSNDIEFDTVLLKKLLQMYLKREDFYTDPKLGIPLIKATIEKIDPNNECIKSIGSNNVGLTKQIHNRLNTDEQKKHTTLLGWTELKNNISNKPDNEPLLSLYLQNRKNNSAVTYYFDKDGEKLLGEIIIKSELSSS